MGNTRSAGEGSCGGGRSSVCLIIRFVFVWCGKKQLLVRAVKVKSHTPTTPSNAVRRRLSEASCNKKLELYPVCSMDLKDKRKYYDGVPSSGGAKQPF